MNPNNIAAPNDSENESIPSAQKLQSAHSQHGKQVPSSPKLASLVYTVAEAAAVLNVSTKTIRRLLDRRILTCSKALRKKLIPRKQIEDFLKATCDVPRTLN